MNKSGGFIFTAVIFLEFFLKICKVINLYRTHLIYFLLLGEFIYLRPQAPEGLCENCCSVIISAISFLIVGNHKKYRDFSAIFRTLRCFIYFIKSCKHHLYSRFTSQASRFKVNYTIQNVRFFRL